MLRFYNTALALQEVPDEISLAVNFTGCPYHCKGCHSPHLWQTDGGHPVSELWPIIDRYGNNITCICLMGGDWDLKSLDVITGLITDLYPEKKIALYSVPDIDYWFMHQPAKRIADRLTYLKTGKYIEELGGLASPETNQKFYKLSNGNACLIPPEKFNRKIA